MFFYFFLSLLHERSIKILWFYSRESGAIDMISLFLIWSGLKVKCCGLYDANLNYCEYQIEYLTLGEKLEK